MLNYLTEKIEFPNLFSGDISIDRVAFSVFGIDIYWYGIIIALGVVLGFAYALKHAKKVGLLSDNVFDTAFIATIFGFIGARAYYCIFYNLDPANKTKYTLWTAITGVRDGGLAIYGGIIAAVITAFIVCKIKKTKMLPLLDLAGVGFLIGQGIGRWGNFVNQEAFGAPTASDLPWGMTGTTIVNSSNYINACQSLGIESGLVHPCFLYESLWCLVGFLLIHFIGNKIRSFDGEIFLFYVMWYGAGRGWIEGLRTDSLYAGSLRISQVIAIATAVFALFLVIFFKLKLRNTDYKMYKDTDESIEKLAAFEKAAAHEKEMKAARKAMKEAEAPVAPSILGDDVENIAAKHATPMEKTDEEKNDGENN